MWLQLFVTKHVDCTDRARKGDVMACVDFPVSLSAQHECTQKEEQKKPDDNKQYQPLPSYQIYNLTEYGLHETVPCQDYPVSIQMSGITEKQEQKPVESHVLIVKIVASQKFYH